MPRKAKKSALALTDQARALLEELIVTLELPPGSVWSEAQLSERLGIGRTLVQEGLQTEAPTIGARLGVPEIGLRPEAMGTVDGLSKYPYIREARRIRAKKTIIEQVVSALHQPGPRVVHIADSVGVGWYPIDIHRSGPDDVG